MRIGLDFDGVISDCGALKCEVARHMYGLDIPAGKFKKELLVGEGLLTLDRYRALQRLVYGTREFGLRMRPVPGALEGISHLLAQGHALTVITSRTGPELEIAREWMGTVGLDVPSVGVGYGVSKADAAADVDVFVDDDLEKLEPLVGSVPHRVLFSWEYNAHVDAGGIANRIGSWPELVDFVRSRAMAAHRAPIGR